MAAAPESLQQFAHFDAAALVKSDRVHSAIFTDPQIFELEMARIFRRAWLFALHESEIPNPGDYKQIQLAGYPVIATRDRQGDIHLLINRCRHRGATVCQHAHGNDKVLRCWYHGWIYGLDGTLMELPVPEAYPGGPDMDALGLTRVPRMDSYRGFVFASFAEQGASLDEYLGPARGFIDIVCDYSPTGKVRVKPGVVHKAMYRANWKQVGMDGYHVHYVHASVINLFSRRTSTTGSAVGALQVEDPYTDAASSQTRGFPNGHAALDLRIQRRAHAATYIGELEKTAAGKAYVDIMVERHGRERAGDIIALHGDPHLGVFPNLQLIHDHVRVVIPISADETQVLMYPIYLEDVPDEVNEQRLRHHEDFYGPASTGSPDDMVLFEQTQQGLSAPLDPWILIGRGLGREQRDPDGTVAGKITDETTQRAQFQAWKTLMSQP